MDLFSPDSLDLTNAFTESIPEIKGFEKFHAIGESHFDVTAVRMRRLGWSVFPQEKDGGRKPATIDNHTLAWGQYKFEAAPIEEVERWALQAGKENTAIILGQASGNVFCLDCDIVDEVLSQQVQTLAFEILGPTPFVREGQYPKVALLYRVAEPELLPNNSSFTFVEPDPESIGKNQIEILSQGKPITSHGVHHRVGEYFAWLDINPTQLGPEGAPIVTEDAVLEFLEAVQKIRAFHRPANAINPDAAWDWVKTDDVVRPRYTAKVGARGWVEDQNGRIKDGRENFLFSLSQRYAQYNPGLCQDDAGITKLKQMVYEEFRAKAVMDGRWTEGETRKEIHSKVSRSARQIRDGGLTPKVAGRQKAQTAPTPKSEPIVVDHEEAEETHMLGFVRGASKATRQGLRVTNLADGAYISAVDMTKRDERALQPDRTVISADVQGQLTRALDKFWAEVYDTTRTYVPPIHLLKAPTGAGKTTRTIRYIGADYRTKMWDQARSRGEETPGPIVFLLPTYHNIAELRLRAEVLNLDATLTDKELGEQAMERGLVAEENLESQLEDLKRDAMNAGLTTMIYKGKVAAGCKMEDKVKLLMEAGIGTAGLCKAKVITKGEEPEEKVCVHYSSCSAIQQRKQIASCHVVFLPHAFLTLSIPEELKNARAVVADERIFTLFVHTTTFNLFSLRLPRREPKLTKREREENMSPTDLLDNRARAAEVAIDALQNRQCPANALSRYTFKIRDREILGYDLVKSAVRVCSSAISANSNVTPDLSYEDVVDICSKPTGTQIREEFRFWKIIEERIEQLIPDMVNRQLDPTFQFNIPKKAMGDRDMRIQFLIEEDANGHRAEKIRLSWRSDPNWAEVPFLLLDASASPAITSKIFGQRPVEIHNIDAPLNVRTLLIGDRTYSNSSIVAKYGGRNERMHAAKLKVNMQRLVSLTSSVFGYGRVIAGGSVAVRRAINTAWVSPKNVDWGHFGALRGLDFAKRHAAAISFGRMEVPTRTIDGIVAALTYDDDIPEQPFDYNGTGVGLDLLPLVPPASNQTVMLRSGQDANIPVPRYPGTWASEVQQQYREEELRQFLGRLRPVYRSGDAPVWIAVSKVIPDGVIVDDIVSLDDVLKFAGKHMHVWDAVRTTDGVLQSDLALAAFPFAHASETVWRQRMLMLGFDEVKGTLRKDSRHTWGFTPVKFSTQDNVVRYAFVRTEVRDPAEAVIRAFDEFMEVEVNVIEVMEPQVPRQDSVTRDIDWVGEELGTYEQRRIDEERFLAEASTYAVATMDAEQIKDPNGRHGDTLPLRVQAKMADTKQVRIDVFELAALNSTDQMWKSVTAIEASKITSPVLEISDNYENFGDGVFDDDGM